MTFFLRKVFRQFTIFRRRKPARRKFFQPLVEFMEDRCVPAQIPVTTNLDNDQNLIAGSLRAAIAAAGPNDEIVFDAIAGRAIHLQSQITIDKNLWINGAANGVSITTDSAIGQANGRAFFCKGPALPASLRDVTISVTGIAFANCVPATGDGGAIYVMGSLTLTNCTFQQNFANNGGAVYVEPKTATNSVTVIGCTFQLNEAQGVGGGLCVDDDYLSPLQPAVTVSVSPSQFLSNKADLSGGAIGISNIASTVNVVNSLFRRNTGDASGGAIYSDSHVLSVTAPGGRAFVFEDNRSLDGAGVGGAIFWNPTLDRTCTLTLSDLTFDTNTANQGGAVACSFDSAASNNTLTQTINGCLFKDNRANGTANTATQDGGALYIHSSTKGNQAASLAVTNTTFYENASRHDGGAIAIDNVTADDATNTVSLTSLTVVGNRAINEGGGVFTQAPVDSNTSFWNCIVAENRAQSGVDVFGPVNSQGFNLIGVADGVASWQGNVSPEPDQTGSPALPLNPGLPGLANNGGLTLTVSVPANSPAYRAGDPSLQGSSAPLNRDQRGQLRNDSVGGQNKVTVGAYDPGARGNVANQAPVGASNTVAMNEDSAYAFAGTDFGFSDSSDSPPNSLLAVEITSLPSSGRLLYFGVVVVQGEVVSGGAIGLGGLAFYPDAGASGSSYATFSFKVQDDGGTANSGSDTDATARTMTINVTSVNDAPEGTDNTVTTLKNAPFTFTAASFGLTDPHDTSANSLANVKITSLPGSGTLTKNGSAVSANDLISLTELNNNWLVFTPAANATGTPHASFTFQVQDDGGTANSGVNLDPTANTMKINVMDTTFVNDAPVGTATAVTTLQNTAHAFTAATFGFTDPSDTPANAFLAVQITTLPTGGTLKDNGLTLSAGDFVSASHLTAGLLVYMPNTNSGGTAYDSFTFKVRDDGGTDNSGVNTDTTARTMTINVTLVNQPPVGADNTVTTYQNVPHAFATADFGFDDPNSSPADVLYAVKITSLPMFGTLTNNGSAVAVGDSISASAIASGHLVFTPEANYFGSPYDAFYFRVQDDGGTSGGGVDLDLTARRMTINVTWVNLSPEGASNTVATNEDTPYALKAIDFGFSDPDELFPNWFEAVKITSLPGAGSLTLNGGSVSANQFIDLDDILDGLLVFTPAANASGTSHANFGFKVQDDGGTANGGVDLDTTARTLTIDVAAVNDAPVNTLPGTQSTSEETSLVLSTANSNAISIADVDAGSSTMQVTLTTAQGTLTLSGTSGLSFSFADANGTGAGDGTTDATMTFRGSVSAINVALNGLTFTPATNFDASAAIQVQTKDLGNTGSGGVQSDTDTLTITVNGINDAPVATVPAAQSTAVNTNLVFSSGNSNAISIADVDAHPYELWLYLSVQHGSLTLGATSGLTFTLGDGSGDTTVAFYGTLANINAALSGLTFIPTTDYEGEDELYVQIDDQGAYGTGTNLYDIETVQIDIGI